LKEDEPAWISDPDLHGKGRCRGQAIQEGRVRCCRGGQQSTGSEGIDDIGAEGAALFYLVANAGKVRGFVIRTPLGAAREMQAGIASGAGAFAVGEALAAVH